MDEKNVQPISSNSPQSNSIVPPAAPIFRPGTPIASLIPEDSPAARAMMNDAASENPIPVRVSQPIAQTAPQPESLPADDDVIITEDPVPVMDTAPAASSVVPSTPLVEKTASLSEVSSPSATGAVSDGVSVSNSGTPTIVPQSARPVPKIPLKDVFIPPAPVKPAEIQRPVPPVQEASSVQAAREAYGESSPKSDPLPDFEIPTLRTYKNDINRTVESDKITTAKILMAEQKAQENKAAFVPETSVKKPKNAFALFFGILLMLGAFGALGYFGYTRLSNLPPKITFDTASFFLFAYDKEEFVDASAVKSDIFASVHEVIAKTAQMKEGTYTEIVLYKEDRETKTARRISAAEFFTLYDVELPTNISRSLSTNYSYGLYKTEDSVEPFIVLGLVDFENAYDSMFVWEPTLALDMKGFFPNLMKIFADNPEVPAEVPAIEVATSTATTTPTATTTKPVATSMPAGATSTASTTAPVVAYEPINRNVQFIDLVLSNRDTRALRDQNGTPYFYYTFIDRDKILFAQDSDLIAEIVRKVREKQLVR